MGPGDSDIEEHALGVDGRAHPNERTEGSEKGRRQKVGQAGIDAMIDGREVVAQFMRHQNGEQGERKRQTLQQERRVMPRPEVHIEAMFDIERKIAVEIDLHGRPDHGGGEQGDRKQQSVKPIALYCGCFFFGRKLTGAVFREERVGRRRKILG